jgi:transcriptional regulator with XRE-family HTH domain
MIGKYERCEAVPLIEVAKKTADAFEVSLDYLVGEGINSKFEIKRRSSDYKILKNWKLATRNTFLLCWMISFLKIKCRQF